MAIGISSGIHADPLLCSMLCIIGVVYRVVAYVLLITFHRNKQR